MCIRDRPYSENAIFLLLFLSTLGHGSDQVNSFVMMTKEGSTKIVNFMTPWAWVLILRHGHIWHYSEYALSSTLSIYSTLIAIVLRDSHTAFLCHVYFYLFSDGAVDMQIWALLTRSKCEVSDTQVTVRACGPLVSYHILYMIIIICSHFNNKYKIVI